MALTTLPYVVGYAAQTSAWRFGGFLIGVDDGNSYIAKMGEGARGAWLFTLPYSSEPQRGVLIYTFYLALGKLAGTNHDTQVLVFHLARVVFGFALMLVSYRFLAEFLPRVYQRRVALALVALGGGLGWLLTLLGWGQLFGSLPIDFYSPETYSFLILYLLPHLAAARCLFLLGLLAYWRGRGVAAGLLFFGVSLIQPLYVIVAWAILTADFVLGWWAARRNTQSAIQNTQPSAVRAPRPTPQAWRSLIVTTGLSAPLVLYTLALFATDPLINQWGKQNVLFSPHPLHYLFGYGVLLLLAAFGWRAFAHRWPRLARFTAAWAVAVPFLIYAPLSTQRRLIEGFQLPLVAVAVWGLTVTLRRLRRWILIPVLALTLPTSAVLLAGGVGGALVLVEPIFHPADQLAAFDWLTHHAQAGQVALATYGTGNALPAYTPLIAYIGHGSETVFLSAKEGRVIRFYQSATSDADRRQLLAEGRIAFVILHAHERNRADFNPDAVNYLRWRFSSGDYSIYEVIR
jgi:hypothetical protein